ncbi:alpha/beta hydrolase [Limnobacter humi]|uniref:Alpha/beta hydrolase n=1 Tax=Limnobacter humi TaxID=1778671 RepID=A0ABT1WF51_9BURK|nr:alpha/beta hydrolase [Limnobacter humi]
MLKSTTRKKRIEPKPVSEGARLVDQYFDTVGDSFLRHSKAPEPELLENWRPKIFSLTRLNPWYGGLVGVHRRRIGVGKDKLVWLEVGQSSQPTLLLLHGFAAAKEHWLPIVPFLAGYFRILMPDLPGWGESGFNPHKQYGLEDQTDRLAHWLGEIGVHKVNVVGNSMGGALAGLLTARHPHLVTSSVLMDALGLPGETHTEFVDELLRGKNKLVPRDPVDVMKLTDLVFHNRALAASAAFFSATELVHRRDVNTFLFREMLSRRPDYTKATFEDIGTPTLVMWGTEDKVLHPSCAHTFEKLIKRSELCLFDNVGHLPMIETPYMCAQAIKTFVRKHL